MTGICVVPAKEAPLRSSREKELAAELCRRDMGGAPAHAPGRLIQSGYSSVPSMGPQSPHRVHASSGEIEQITSGDCSVLGWKKALEDDTFAVHLSSPALIGDVFVLDPNGGSSPWGDFDEDSGPSPFAIKASKPYTVRRITAVNDELLSSVELSLPTEFTATSADGTKVLGWIMKPVGLKEGKKYPIALEIHGGPHAAYGFVFHHEFQLLAARGYGVVFSNPRAV